LSSETPEPRGVKRTAPEDGISAAGAEDDRWLQCSIGL